MKVLVATDGSKFSLHAVKYASSLVSALQPAAHSVTLINVHDDTGLRHAKSFVGGEAVADYLRDLSQKQLKPARKLLMAADVAHDVVIRTGHVAQEIIECAKDGKYDLIVMGSKGRSAVADFLIGSVAQRVLAVAKQPVLLVK